MLVLGNGVPVPDSGTGALPTRSGLCHDLRRAAPRERDARAAVPVVVDHPSAVELFHFDPNIWSGRAKAHPVVEDACVV